LLIHSNDFLNLFIVGNEETVWAAFRSLFVYIEAAGGLVFNPSNELLMIYRNNHWDLPKGKMEKGELNHQTALREVEEECGITNLTITKQLTNTYHIFNNHAETIKCTYWFKMKCDDTLLPTPQTEEGIEKAQWMNQTAVQQVYSDIFLSLKDILTEASFLSS
jgi:8-oxo-dGTP pyrophosphatase MutT (NUDIX family)